MAIGNHLLDALISDLLTDLTTIKPDTLIKTCNAKLPFTLSKYLQPQVPVRTVIDRSEGELLLSNIARPEHSFGESP